MSRKVALSLTLAAQFCVASLAANSPARAGGAIPDYFFREWTVTKNCTEAHAGLAARVDAGLKFKIAAGKDGGYVFVAEDAGHSRWAANWNGLQLTYRAGTQMTSLPADFECIPGAESQLALSRDVRFRAVRGALLRAGALVRTCEDPRAARARTDLPAQCHWGRIRSHRAAIRQCAGHRTAR